MKKICVESDFSARIRLIVAASESIVAENASAIASIVLWGWVGWVGWVGEEEGWV